MTGDAEPGRRRIARLGGRGDALHEADCCVYEPPGRSSCCRRGALTRRYWSAQLAASAFKSCDQQSF